MSKSIYLADDMNQGSASGRRRFELQRKIADGFAHALKTPIEVLHVESPSEFPYPEPAYEKTFRSLRTKCHQRLPDKKKRFSARAFFNLRVGDPAAQIVASAKNPGRVEMIVMGTHGRSGLKKLILGSVAEDVISRSKVPVLCVGAKLQRKGLRLNLKKPIRIVVPTDLGENSKRAEAYALTLAERLKAEVLFVHGLYDSAYPFLQGDFSNPGSYDRGDWFALLCKEAGAALARKKRTAEARGIRCRVVLESRFIPITRAVLSRCPSDHAIVVVGTHAKSRFRHAFLGSTARELIAASPVPVIIVASKR